MMEFTLLERAVLDWMAEHLEIPNLKSQIQAAVPTGRCYTGHGFFTSLTVPSDLPSIQSLSPISGPVIESEGIDYGGGVLLFLDDTGHIDTLEMYAHGDRFAEFINTFDLKAWEERNK